MKPPRISEPIISRGLEILSHDSRPAGYDPATHGSAAVIRPSISSGMRGLFFKLGAHSFSGDSKVTIVSGAGSGAASSNVSGTGTLFGIGYDSEISQNMNVRYAYTNYNKIAGVTGSEANVFTVGVNFKF